MISNPESYATACKKPQVARTSRLAGNEHARKELFSEEQSLPQEVSKSTGIEVLFQPQQTARRSYRNCSEAIYLEILLNLAIYT